MKSKIVTIVLLLVSSFAFSQQLTYKKGKVYDQNDEKLSNNQVKEILAANPESLEMYKKGKSKASIGGFLLGLGGGLVIADLVSGLTQDKVYPTALTYVGLASAAISIPIISGHSKKTKNAIDTFNETTNAKTVGFTVEKINVLSNKNGIGMQISF